MKSLAERLDALTYKTADCWFFIGNTSPPKGYGRIYVGPERGDCESAHRAALELKLGRKLLPGMDAAHTCDIPNCVNPDHLFEATRQQNVHDAQRKGMWSGAWHLSVEERHRNALLGGMGRGRQLYGR